VELSILRVWETHRRLPLKVAIGTLCAIGALSILFGSFKRLSLYCRGASVFAAVESIDIGKVEATEERLAACKIQNYSFYDVQILGGRASCGCAVLENIPLTIPGFGCGVVNIRFKGPKKIPEKPSRHTIMLFSDNGQEPIIFAITATIIERKAAKDIKQREEGK